MQASPVEFRREIERLETEQRRLQALLVQQQRLLDKIEAGGMPESTPFVSYRRGSDVLDLAGPAGGIRAAFRSEIAQIQSQIRRLHDQAAGLRRDQRSAERQQRRAAVARIDRRFEDRVRQVLARAKQRGHFADGELAELQSTGDQVLAAYIDLLAIDSSEQAMGDVLRQFAEVQHLGDGDPQVSRRAMLALVAASRSNLANARRAHGRSRSVATARGILRAAGWCELLGGDSGTAVGSTADWAEQEMKDAEQQFRRAPTAANLKYMLQAERLATSLSRKPLPSPPAGLKRIRAGEQHVIGSGDTLSGLAKHYYGSFAYWDVLVRANTDLWLDPDRPPRGTIRIPF